MKCSYCGRAIVGKPKAWHIVYTGERVPIHKTCKHRLTAPDYCPCDICDTDIHGG